MNLTNLFDSKKNEIDIVKVRKMRFHIYSLERRNYLRREFTHAQMREKIREIIISEYNKNIGG